MGLPSHCWKSWGLQYRLWKEDFEMPLLRFRVFVVQSSRIYLAS